MDTPSRPVQPSKPRHFLRYFLFSTLGLFVFILLLVVGGVTYLRSQAGSERVLKLAQSELKERAGVRLEFTEGRLDPLSGLQFRDLRLVRAAPEGDLDLAVANVEIRYSLSLLKRRFELTEFRIVRPKIKLKIVKASAAVEKKDEPGSDGSSGIERLQALLLTPPLEFIADKVAIEDLEVDFENQLGENRTRFKLEKLNLLVHLSLLREKFALKARLEPEAKYQLDLKMRSEKGALQSIVSRGALGGEWAAGLRREGSEWVYEIEPSKFSMALGPLTVNIQDNSSSTHLQLKALKAQAKLGLLARTEELFKGSQDAVKSDDVAAEIELGALQVETRNLKSSSQVTIERQVVALASQMTKAVDVELTYQAKKLVLHNVLAQPLAITLKSKTELERDLKSAKVNVGLEVNSAKLAQLLSTISRDDGGGTTASGTLEAQFARDLLTLLKPGALKGSSRKNAERLLPLRLDSRYTVQLGQDGALKADLDLNLPQINLPSFAKAWMMKLKGSFSRKVNGQLEADAEFAAENGEFGNWRLATKTSFQPQPLQTQGLTEITQLAKGDLKKMPVVLLEPVKLEHRVNFQPQDQTVSFHLVAPALHVEKVATVKETRVEFVARSQDLQSGKNADLDLKVSEGAIELDPSLGKTPLPIKGIEVVAKAALRDAERLNLESLNINLNEKSLSLTAEGSANTKTKDVQLKAEASVDVAEGLEVAGQLVRGRVKLPLALTVYQGREASLQGGVEFHELAWAKDKLAVSGINGRLPFAEKLVWDGKDIRFQNLIKQNPFERVDFERVRPFLQGTEQVRIEKIRWEEREYGPFVGFLSLNQNMLAVHQFDLDLGPGRVYGEMFFDAYPANLQLGLLARMTNLDLGEILPKRFLARMAEGSKTVSGRSGFVLHLNRGVLDGRVDLTELGGQQLVALINTIDPSYEDEKMNKVRGLLQLGYPTAVALSFQDGYMDMNVDLSVLGVAQRQSLREIPLSSLLGRVTQDIVKKTEKGPLKQ